VLDAYERAYVNNTCVGSKEFIDSIFAKEKAYMEILYLPIESKGVSKESEAKALNNIKIILDIEYVAPLAWQLGFQRPVTEAMGYISSFHDALIWLLVAIIGIVGAILLIIIRKSDDSAKVSAENEQTAVGTIKKISELTLEVIWVCIPTLITFLLLLMSTALLSKLDEITSSAKSFVTLQAFGYQWYWGYETATIDSFGEVEIEQYTCYMLDHESEDLFRFRLFILETDTLVKIKAGVNVKLVGTGNDVIHSWAMPSCGVKIDCIPGKINSAVFAVLVPNVHIFGQCSELCGLQHGFMPIHMFAEL
jgi:cytochrome c oxidase subunit 2